MREAFQLDGSLMSVELAPFDNYSGTRSVVVAFSAEKLNFSELEEHRAQDAFKDATDYLRILLFQEYAATASANLGRYEQFAAALLQNSPRSKSVIDLCKETIERIKSIFGVTETYIFLKRANSRLGTWYPRVDSQKQLALDSLLTWPPQHEQLALNRHEQANPGPENLVVLGNNLAWCRVQAKSADDTTIVCCAARSAHSFSNYWTDNEVNLLERVLELSHLRLRCALAFETLLGKLGNATNEQQKQFRLWCHLLKEYFGIDQVMITRICPKPNQFVIKCEMHDGFIGHEEISSCKKVCNPAKRSSRPDIMVRILEDYLDNDPKAKGIYEAECENKYYPDFTLDEKLISACRMKGRILFVPCYCRDDATSQQVLRSIMHLASSTGKLEVSSEQEPILMTLGERVAEWLVANDREKFNKATKEITSVEVATKESIEEICRTLLSTIHARGASFFINISNLGLLGVDAPSMDSIENLFCQFLRAFEQWEYFTLPEENSAAKANEKTAKDRLVSMFSEFLGISFSDCTQVLGSLDTNEIARVVSRATYLRAGAAHFSNDISVATNGIKDFCRLCETCDGLLTHQLVEEFGTLLLKQCYFPGLGLTGWVLRYCRSLALNQKTSTSNSTYCITLQPQPEALWRLRILRLLNELGIASERSTLSAGGCREPTHANHVPEHRESSPNESMIATPIEGFEISELPTGVLRVTGGGAMPHGVESIHQELVEIASRHIANLLRTEHLRRKQYIEGVLAFQGIEFDANHSFRRLDEILCKFNDPATDEPELISKAFSRLREITDSALGRDEHISIALEVRDMRHSAICAGDFEKILTRWVTAVKIEMRTICEDKFSRIIDKSVAINTCRTVEEVLKNLRRHLGVQNPIVRINASGLVLIGIPSYNWSEPVGYSNQWLPYRTLASDKRSGGGTRLLQEVELTSDIHVQYLTLGSMNEMVVKISLPAHGET